MEISSTGMSKETGVMRREAGYTLEPCRPIAGIGELWPVLSASSWMLSYAVPSKLLLFW